MNKLILMGLGIKVHGKRWVGWQDGIEDTRLYDMMNVVFKAYGFGTLKI